MRLITIILGLVVCLLAPTAGHAGEKKISKESIKAPQKSIDEQTLDELRNIETIISTEPEEAIKQLDLIIKRTISSNLNESMSLAYLLMGKAYKELQQPQLALHFLEQARVKYLENTSRSKYEYEKLKSEKKKPLPPAPLPANYFLEIAEVYAMLGQFESSNSNYQSYKKQVSDASQLQQANYALANNLYALERYDAAIVAYLDLLQEEQNDNDVAGIRRCYSRLAACYISKDDTDKGLEYYSLSVEDIQLSEASTSLELNKNKEIVSQALRKQNRFKEQAELLNQTIDVIDDGVEHLRLARAYFDNNDLTQAESSLDTYFSDISYNLIDASEIEVIKKMVNVLRQNGQHQKGLTYLLRYEELQDSIQNRLLSLRLRSQEVGAFGYQNMLQLEVLQKDRQISENTINHLMDQGELKEELLSFQKYLIYALCGIILLSLIALIYILRVSRQRRVANQQLALRSLRSQMNPHFIFNALNSVNSFISVSDERSANRFLSEFSRLMRTVMENSEYDFIPLNKELEIIKIYLELEHFRFKDKFSYTLNIAPDLDEESYRLPPMLIQPYIENAIWHGLRYKETVGQLTVTLSDVQGDLKVVVEDDGIGRKKSQELKTKNQKKSKSTALKNIGERVKILQQLHHLKLNILQEDGLPDGTGTRITLIIGQNNG